MACFIAASLVAGLTIMVLQKLGVQWSIQTTLGALMARLLVYMVFIGLFAAVPFAVLKQKISKRQMGLGRQLSFTDIGLALAGLVVYGLLTVVTQYMLTHVTGFQPDQTQDLGISTRLFGGDLLWAYLVLVVATPLCEEILFRGMLYGQLRSHHMSKWLTALIVSTLFGLAHGQWNVGMDVFCLSLVACYLREVTGTIWPAVIMHVIKNAVAFYFVFIVAHSVSG